MRKIYEYSSPGIMMGESWAGEPANFLASPASAPDFFSSSSGSEFFSQAAPTPAIFFERLRLQGLKKQAPAPDYWLRLANYSFPHTLVR